jgi:MGT family glycosyltransferase
VSKTGHAAFFSLPASGHVNPTLALVEELVSRGERVDYWCTEPFRAVIERTGARFCKAPPILERLETMDPFSGLLSLGEFIAEATLEVLPPLRAALEAERPDYILHDTMTPWGRLLAQLLGLPSIATFASFATVPEKTPLPPLPVLLMIPSPSHLLRNVMRLRRRAQLTRETARRFGVDELKLGNVITNPEACNIVFTSERFQLSPMDERFHFVGATLSEPPDPTFPFSELEGKRVIYASLGTVFNDTPAFFRAVVDTFDRADEVVVIGAGKRVDLGKLGPLPKNAIVRAHVAQLEVLRRASLFITHGGMNSVSAGIVHSVPMLVKPQGADNFVIAKRLQALGAGRVLRQADLKPPRLRALAEALMGDEGVKRSLSELSDSLRLAGGAKRAADIVIAHRGTPSMSRGVPQAMAGN